MGWGGQEENDSKEAMTRAWEAGINHWDTADVYGSGRSEKLIGSMWNDIPRDKVFLATKVGWDQGPHPNWYNPAHMRKKMEQSLVNLKTDCVDLLYLHHCNFGKKGEYFDDALDVALRFQNEGKMRYLGLSDWDLTKIINFIEKADPDVIQPYRNLYEDTYKSSGLQDYIEKHNLGVCFFSPLMHGLLTGKYSKPTEFSVGDFRKNIVAFKNKDVISLFQKNAKKLKEKLYEHPHPVIHGVIDSLISDSKNSCVLLGQRNANQVAVASTLGRLISEENVSWIKNIYKT